MWIVKNTKFEILNDMGELGDMYLVKGTPGNYLVKGTPGNYLVKGTLGNYLVKGTPGNNIKGFLNYKSKIIKLLRALSCLVQTEDKTDIFNIYTDVKFSSPPPLLTLIFQFHPHRIVQLNNKISCQGNILPEKKKRV